MRVATFSLGLNINLLRSGGRSTIVLPGSLQVGSGSVHASPNEHVSLGFQTIKQSISQVDLLLSVRVAITAASATTATTTSTTATTTATASATSPESTLLVLVASLLPVILISRGTAAGGSLAKVPALVKLLLRCSVRRQLSLLDQIALLLAVVVLGHDLQVVLLPLGSRVGGDELLGRLLIGKCDKDGALEEALVGATELQAIDFTELGKEGLQLELGIGLLVTKALDVDSGSFGLGLGGGHGLVGHLALDGLLAFLSNHLEYLALSEGSNNGAVGLEAAHTLE